MLSVCARVCVCVCVRVYVYLQLKDCDKTYYKKYAHSSAVTFNFLHTLAKHSGQINVM